MRKLLSVGLIACLCAILCSCETMGDKTKKGAGIGALSGAAIGGIVGHQGGHGWEGALIGAAAGATAGGLIGNQMDKSEDADDSLSLQDIVRMTQDGVPDSEIIAEIERTGATFSLKTEGINYLRENGVSDTVIDYMLSARE